MVAVVSLFKLKRCQNNVVGSEVYSVLEQHWGVCDIL